ncbi:hypothetical protein BAE44_0021082 [Dichanthelium oligosanthes]|uniref:Uncharacterized protein n=1 Tax=Dichanthelium oligosanthes TaxID=888268 RepID=A0A1E5UYF8_9POAL|nr:hypothetical protein BAE44_0021082 [Dichanthelium oligosanthes]
MAEEPLDASPPATSAAAAADGVSSSSAPAPAPALRPRREAFEHGLLPIPKLVFPEGTLTQTLAQLKERLAPGGARVGAAALAEALQIPAEQAALALGTLAAVLPAEDPALGEDGAGEADLRDLLLFLYIQSYKRLVPRGHKDSPAVADVWPSTSAFDGCLSALSPIQVLTVETFEHLGFLLQLSKGTPLSQAASFFANSDPDMPAAPVPAALVHDWILQHIASTLEFMAEKSSAKENSQQNASDPDVTMSDAVTNTRIHSNSPTGTSAPNNPGYYRNTTFVEGLSKTSVVKQASDMKGNSIKLQDWNFKAEPHLSMQPSMDVLTLPSFLVLLVAPFNTYYPQLGEHLAQVGVDPNVNKWDQPFVLGVVDPHDSLSHPAGVSDVQAESATCLDPDLFTNFLIPSWFEPRGPTKYNPFTLPEVYWASQRKKHASLEDIQKNIRELEIDDNRKKELACALHAQFKDWLYVGGPVSLHARVSFPILQSLLLNIL